MLERAENQEELQMLYQVTSPMPNPTPFLFLSAILATLWLAGCAHAEPIRGRVVGVADGDTLTVLDASNRQHKIRLAGIDSPEKRQPFGQVCKQSLSDLAYERAVLVESSKRDRYGRVVGKVLADGQDVNLEQLRRGCGWHYKQYQNDQSLDDRLAYNAAEVSARKDRIGLWVDRNPVPPWEWRKAGNK